MSIQIPDRIANLISNPHTSIAGLVFIACKLGKIWLPKYAPQFETTEGVAVAYGFGMAGDAKPQEVVKSQSQPPAGAGTPKS